MWRAGSFHDRKCSAVASAAHNAIVALIGPPTQPAFDPPSDPPVTVDRDAKHRVGNGGADRHCARHDFRNVRKAATICRKSAFIRGIPAVNSGPVCNSLGGD
jgi:hypothetical protein